MLSKRKLTKKVKIGDKFIGGESRILLQSMTNTKTSDVQSTIKQIKRLEAAGCEIVRVSVPDKDSAKALKSIKEHISIPLIADIHFDYRLAIMAVEMGADALRLNPGNIGGDQRLLEAANAAKQNGASMRIGVNMGSLDKEVSDKLGYTPEAMVKSALDKISLLEEKAKFYNIVVSLKSSDVEKTIKAYSLFSGKSDYPLHLGITEAGTYISGSVKSSIGIGYLLLNGIGDTIRVSLSDDPVKEIEVGRLILKTAGCITGPEIISCPTCARTNIDIIGMSKTVENALKNVNKNIKVAVMGCAVNGPGEAKNADIGIAGGAGSALLFVKGKIIGKYPQEEIISVLLEKINNMDFQ